MTHLPEQPADSLLLLLGGSKCSSLQYTHDARVTLVSTTLPEHPQGTGGAGLGMPNIVTLLFLGFNRDYFCSTRGRSNTESSLYTYDDRSLESRGLPPTLFAAILLGLYMAHVTCSSCLEYSPRFIGISTRYFSNCVICYVQTLLRFL